LKGKRLFVPWASITAIQQHRINVLGAAEDFEMNSPLTAGEELDKTSGT
jgi:hypothetical protein